MIEDIKRTVDELNEEADIAADFIEGIMDTLGLDGDIEMITRDDRAVVEVVTEDESTIQKFVGKDERSLSALQALSRAVVRKSTGLPTRLVVDVAGTRKKADERIIEIAKESLKKALDTKEEVQLRAMNSYKRRLVHDYVKNEGYTTRSRGVEPYRKVVILPEKFVADEKESTEKKSPAKKTTVKKETAKKSTTKKVAAKKTEK